MNSIIEQFMYKPGKFTEKGEITEKAKQLSLQHPKQWSGKCRAANRTPQCRDEQTLL